MGSRRNTSWTCHDCCKKYTKTTDKLMECEFCSDYFCCKCLNMEDNEYFCLKQSTCMWFCKECKPKVVEKIKDNEIEILCNNHFEKYKTQLDNLSKLVESKLNRQEVNDMIETNNADNANNQVISSEETINKLIQKQVEKQSFADIVNKKDDSQKEMPQTDKNQVQTVERKIIDNTINSVIHVEDETDKEAVDRKNREQNVIVFNMKEPKTNLISERQQLDIDEVNKLIDFLQVESFEDLTIEKVARMGIRPKNVETTPRPLIVKFKHLEAKRAFLRYSYGLKDSDDEHIQNISVQNDMTKKDREAENELVKKMKQKNSQGTGPLKYVIRGPPGERNLMQIKRQ